MTRGYGVVADWRRAVLLDREQTQILVSDSRSDFFVRNLIAIGPNFAPRSFTIRGRALVSADLTALRRHGQGAATAPLYARA